jgi:hypothetical protein
MSKKIYLYDRNGLTDQYALVDDDNFDRLNIFRWYALNNGNTTYALRRAGRKTILMHTQIIVTTKPLTDHINHNGLDNRRVNLRGVTHSENMHNRKLNINSSTGLKGVSRWKSLYRAEIRANKARYHLGYYSTAVEAAAAYNAASLLLHGDFGLRNPLEVVVHFKVEDANGHVISSDRHTEIAAQVAERLSKKLAVIRSA